jgi:pyridoxamine 5'-phosphate oxidase
MSATPPEKDPIERFAAVYAEVKQKVEEPNAMVVASVGPDGRPSSRVVLLKDFDARGFVFYTNYRSRKGRELLTHPFAAICFYWRLLKQQVRIEGRVEQVAPSEADAYFASRARLSQIGAWASDQSTTLGERAELEHRVRELERQFEGKPVPRPPHWSGLRVVPDRIEFWSERANRLHDRDLYLRTPDGWTRELLFP